MISVLSNHLAQAIAARRARESMQYLGVIEHRPTPHAELLMHMPGEQGMLGITCAKCRKRGRFRGATQFEAAQAARLAGWRMIGATTEDGFVCPRCPGGGKPEAKAA